MLVQRVGRYLDFDPSAAAGDDREHRAGRIGDPHIVLELGHMLLGRRLFRERPRQHEFGLEHRASALDHAVERGRHPADYGVPNPALDVLDDLPGRTLVPAPIDRLGGHPELDYEVCRIIMRLRLAALFSAQPTKPVPLVAHDYPGIGAADKCATL